MIIFSVIAVFFLISHFSLLISTAFAASQADVTCQRFQFPWCGPGVQDPANMVNRFYQVGLGLAGAAAFGVMIYGAILYTVSAGNTSMQGEARQWISGALWGVGLLLGAYLILYTINPRLVNLRNPEITPLPSSTPSVGSGAVLGTAPGSGGGYGINVPGPTAGTGQVNLGPIQGIDVSPNACGNPPCQIDTDLTARLVRLNRGLTEQGIVPLRITEAASSVSTPRADHVSSCHTVGTCADANFPRGNVPSVRDIIATIRESSNARVGIIYEVLNERDRIRLIQSGAPAGNIVTNPGATGPHFHITRL